MKPNFSVTGFSKGIEKPCGPPHGFKTMWRYGKGTDRYGKRTDRYTDLPPDDLLVRLKGALVRL